MNIKKYVSDTINVFGNVLSGIDNAFGKNRIYKNGQKTGEKVNKIIDKVVDKIIPK